MGRKKLSKESIQHIREDWADKDNKMNMVQLGRMFRVSPTLINTIIEDKSYNSNWSEKE